MKLICVGSGSSGNCYILTSHDETLVIEAGIRFLDVKKALKFRVRQIAGVICSHTHSDHAKYAYEYEKAGIPVFKPYKAKSLRQTIQLGGFKVQSFEAVHNVPCCGFLISHADIGKMLYATDTEYVPYTFKDLSVMLIEANWSGEYVDRNEAKWKHVVTGHMSLQTCLGCITANATEALNHVILCHLSAGNSNAAEFLEAAKAIVPAGCTVNIAEKGMVINLGDIPF